MTTPASDIDHLPLLPEVRGWLMDLLIHEEQAQSDLDQLQSDWQRVQRLVHDDQRAEAALLLKLETDTLVEFWQSVEECAEYLHKALVDFNQHGAGQLRDELFKGGAVAGTTGLVAGLAVTGAELPLAANLTLIVAGLGAAAVVGTMGPMEIRYVTRGINERVEILAVLRRRLADACASVTEQRPEQ